MRQNTLTNTSFHAAARWIGGLWLAGALGSAPTLANAQTPPPNPASGTPSAAPDLPPPPGVYTAPPQGSPPPDGAPPPYVVAPPYVLPPGAVLLPGAAGYWVDRTQIPVAHVERRRTGLAVAGAITFGGVYLVNTIVAAFLEDGALAVPLVGPFIEMAQFARTNSSSSLASSAYLGLTFDFLAQAAGISMLVAGLLTHQKVPQYAPRFCLAPYGGAAGAGVMAMGRF